MRDEKSIPPCYAEAQYNLGVCYRDGTGVEKDDAEAVKWYRRAAGKVLLVLNIIPESATKPAPA